MNCNLNDIIVARLIAQTVEYIHGHTQKLFVPKSYYKLTLRMQRNKFKPEKSALYI